MQATPQTLRHSYVWMMLEGGVPIRVVSELAGHASTALTGDRYGHVAERVNRGATDRLGEVLTWARGPTVTATLGALLSRLLSPHRVQAF